MKARIRIIYLAKFQVIGHFLVNRLWFKEEDAKDIFSFRSQTGLTNPGKHNLTRKMG